MEINNTNYKSEEIYMEIKNLTEAALKAYGDKDFNKLHNYEIDSLIRKQVTANDSYKKMKITEIIKKITCMQPKNVDIKYDLNGNMRVEAELKVYLERYVVDDESDTVIEGIKDFVGEYLYKVILIENKNSITTLVCDNCGAKIDKTVSNCPYCGVVNANKNNKLIIADIIKLNFNNTIKDYYNRKDDKRKEEIQEELERVRQQEIRDAINALRLK